MSRLEELKAMSDDELSRLVAEKVMGWTVMQNKEHLTYRVREWSDKCLASDSTLMYCKDWNPSTDHNDAALVRAEIERRGIGVRFVKNLMDGVLPWLGTDSYEFGNLFKLINATPRETCIAAILAVEVVK